MSNKPIEAYIKCPFYISEGKNFISCEGAMKNTCMLTRFSDAENKKNHLRDNCFHEDGGLCPMAKMLFAKYGMVSLKK